MKREIIDRADTVVNLKFAANTQEAQSKIQQTMSQLKDLTDIAKKDEQMGLVKDLRKFGQELQKNIPISKELNQSINDTRNYIQEAFGTEAVNQFNNVLLNTNNTISQTTTLAQKLSNAKMSNIFNTVFNVGAMIAAYNGIKRVTSALGEFSKESINFVETKNLFDVSMGNGVEGLNEYYDRAIQFQDKLGEKLSINTKDSMNYQALFNAMAKSMGIAANEAYKLSENFTKLGYDIASLYNLDPTAAMDKLRAGLAGQTKPLRDIGLDITQQSLTPIAQDLGIDRSVKNMSQAEKMILRYIAVLRQASLAQGDFAKTMDTPANQMRIFNNQISILKRNVGNLWAGMLTKILPYVNAVIMVINKLLQMLGSFFGFSVSSFSGVSIADSIGADEAASDLGGATAAAKEFKKQLMGFDEIHNIELPDTSSGGGGGGGGGGGVSGIDPKLLEAMQDYDNLMDSVKNKANEIRDKILDWLGFDPDGNLREGLTNLEKILDVVKAIGVAFAAWKISSTIAKVVSTLGWVGKEKAMEIAANLTLAIVGIYAQYMGTKHLLEGDVDIFSLLETLLGTAAGTFGIAKLLNTMSNGSLGIGKSIAVGLGITLGIQAVQILTDGIKSNDLAKQIIGSLELGFGVGALTFAALGLQWALPVALAVSVTAFVVSTEMARSVTDLSDRIKDYLKSYEDWAKQLDEQHKAIVNSMKVELGSMGNVEDLLAELEMLVDENGRVKDGYEDRVNYIITEIQKATGKEIEWNGKVIDNYREQINAIKDLIKIKEAEIILEANKERYANSTNALIEATNKLTEAERLHKEQQDEVAKKAQKLTEEYGSVEKARESLMAMMLL